MQVNVSLSVVLTSFLWSNCSLTFCDPADSFGPPPCCVHSSDPANIFHTAQAEASHFLMLVIAIESSDLEEAVNVLTDKLSRFIILSPSAKHAMCKGIQWE